MIRRLLTPALLALALGACGTVTAPAQPAPGAPAVAPGAAEAPATADQAAAAGRILYEAEVGHAAVVRAAVGYKRLPGCSPTRGQPCSDPAVVAQLQRADDVATLAIGAARSAVGNPSFGRSALDTAVSTATGALAAFSALLTSKGIHP